MEFGVDGIKCGVGGNTFFERETMKKGNFIKPFFLIILIVVLINLQAQPAKGLSPSERLAYSTVKIEISNGKGLTGSGTGFYFIFLIDSMRSMPGIITNRHVIHGSKQGKIILTGSKSDGSPDPTNKFTVVFDNFETMWIKHPDSLIDLVFLPIKPVLDQAHSKKFNAFIQYFDKSIIPSPSQLEKLSVAEDILMIGYPVGISDTYNNFPVFRKGIIASHPAYKYNGKDEFLIDAACFPGSSGSPVLIFNQGNYVENGNMIMGGSRIYLLGILYGGPEYNATGKIKVRPIPQRLDTLSMTHIPINLGFVIRSGKLIEFESYIKKIKL